MEHFVNANRNPDSFIKHLGVVGHGQGSESGELEFVGAAMDVTSPQQRRRKKGSGKTKGNFASRSKQFRPQS